ncbi:hypothetical protein [Thiolapillus sp.]
MFTFTKAIALLSIAYGLFLVSSHAQRNPLTEEHPPSNGQSNLTGYRAFIDPESGRLTTPTKQHALEARRFYPEEANALSTSHAGLFEEEVPGKGIRLDLQGRFQSGMFATLNNAGKIMLSHSPETTGNKYPPVPAPKHSVQKE